MRSQDDRLLQRLYKKGANYMGRGWSRGLSEQENNNKNEHYLETYQEPSGCTSAERTSSLKKKKECMLGKNQS
jgi:hypothetical protein